jgi:hypothetical protein
MKITELQLAAFCKKINQDALKTWPFGLTVERYPDGYEISKLFRKPGRKPQQELLLAERVKAKEAHCFLLGFAVAADLSNRREG